MYIDASETRLRQVPGVRAFRFLQIGRVEAFGEPAVDLAEHLSRLVALSRTRHRAGVLRIFVAAGRAEHPWSALHCDSSCSVGKVYRNRLTDPLHQRIRKLRDPLL